MNGLDSIVSRIIEQAKEDSDNIIKKAQEDAEGIISEARETAKMKSDEILDKAEKECSEIKKRGDSFVDLEKRKMLLSAKREVLDDFYGKIAGRLYDMSQEEYIRFYGNIIEHESRYDSIVFSTSEKNNAEKLIDVQKEKGIVFKNVSFSDRLQHGIILKSGNISVVYSIDQIVDAYREETEASVAKELFSK